MDNQTKQAVATLSKIVSSLDVRLAYLDLYVTALTQYEKSLDKQVEKLGKFSEPMKTEILTQPIQADIVLC